MKKTASKATVIPTTQKEGIDGKDILNNGWSCIDVAVYPGPYLNKLNKPLL